jgi:hypothetical protein
MALEEYCLLECNALMSGRSILKFCGKFCIQNTSNDLPDYMASQKSSHHHCENLKSCTIYFLPRSLVHQPEYQPAFLGKPLKECRSQTFIPCDKHFFLCQWSSITENDCLYLVFAQQNDEEYQNESIPHISSSAPWQETDSTQSSYPWFLPLTKLNTVYPTAGSQKNLQLHSLTHNKICNVISTGVQMQSHDGNFPFNRC